MTIEVSVQPDVDEARRRHPKAVVSVDNFGECLVVLSGEIGLQVEPDVIQTVSEAADIAGLSALHLDLANVTFIDSSGIRSLCYSARGFSTAASSFRCR